LYNNIRAPFRATFSDSCTMTNAQTAIGDNLGASINFATPNPFSVRLHTFQ
jgi:hypothetical protein